MSTSKLGDEDKKLIADKMGVTIATTADKTATDADTASKYANLKVTNLLKVAWSKFTAFAMANPWLVAIGATILAIASITKVVDVLTTSTEEHKEELSSLKNEYADIQSEIQSVNTELQTTKERIEELQSKGVLTFTEKKELENLIKQNNELERQNLLLEEQEKRKNKELNKKFVDTMNSDVNNGEYHNYNGSYSKEGTWQYFAGSISLSSGGKYYGSIDEQEYIELQFAKRQELLEKLNGDYTDAQKAQFKKQYDEINSYLEDKNTEFTTNMEGINYISNPSNEDEKSVNNWLDFINDFQDKLAIATTKDAGTKAELQHNTFNRLVDNWQFDETMQGLQDLGEQGQVTADMLNDPKYDEFIAKLVELGVIDSADNLEDIALAFNKVAEASENANKSGILKNFEDAFNAESFKDSAKVLKELAISGELSTKTFTTTRAYIDLLKETGLTAEEAIEKIRGISVAETSLSDIMGSLQSNAKFMNEVTSEISNSGQISFDTLQNIASKYPSLERYVTDYLNGVEGAQENLVSALSRLYNNELDNYREYYVLKQQYDNGWYTNYLENTSSWVSNLASKYGIDLKNYANYLETKAALEERINSLNTTNGKIGQATSDGKFHTDDYIANTSQFTNLKQKEDLTKILNDMVKEYENSIPDPTDLLDKFKDDDYTGGLTESSKSSDTYFDHIETRLDRFNDKLDEAKEKANDTFNGWSVRDNSFGEAIDQAKSLVDEYKEARARYEEEANKSGISESDKELIQFGAIQIDKLPNDDPRKEQFESYQKWWDKIKECDEAIGKLNKDLIQLYSDSREFRWEAFDYLEDSISRITKEADDLIDLLSNKDLFDDKGNLNEYGNATLALHASNIETYKQQAKDYLEEMKSLQKELANGGSQEVLDKYIFI